MSRTRGLTLLEVVVSSALLAFIALVIMSATVPLSDASSESALAMDMDREASKFLTQLRRELRQSGFEANGTARIRVPTPSSVELYMRVAHDGDPAPWRPAGPLWSTPISYALSGGKITRTEGGLAMDVIANVSDVQYSLPANSNTIIITLTLTRKGTRAVAGGPPPDVVRTYRDQVEMLNRSQ
jgi:hypothetical protein